MMSQRSKEVRVIESIRFDYSWFLGSAFAAVAHSLFKFIKCYVKNSITTITCLSQKAVDTTLAVQVRIKHVPLGDSSNF